MLAVCVVHEVVVAQKLGPRDWFALAEASLAGRRVIKVMMIIMMKIMINLSSRDCFALAFSSLSA